MDTKNLSIVRQNFGNSVFTHKVQEVAAEFQGEKAFRVKIGNLSIVSLVLIMLILQIANIHPLFGYLGIILSIVEIIFLIFQLAFKFEEKASLHKSSALKFLGLRNSYTSLITDIMTGNISIKEIIYQRDSLLKEYQVLCDLAPQTGRPEYEEAQKRLNKKGVIEGEDFTWSDEEIDRFLPEEFKLRKIKKKGGGKNEK